MSFKVVVTHRGYCLSSLVPVLSLGALLVRSLILFVYLKMYMALLQGGGSISGSESWELMQRFPRPSITREMPLRLSFLLAPVTSDWSLFPFSSRKICLEVSSFT